MFYFAYGSNLLRRRIEDRLGDCYLQGSGWLVGYDLRFDKIGADGSGKCSVYKSDKMSNKVYGAIFELTSAQKVRLAPGLRSRPSQTSGGHNY